jgi:subfamily B ATP-binding cassette protein MsbA
MPQNTIQIYKRLLIYITPHKKFFFISIIGFLVYSATQPLFAQMIQEIIDTLQAKSHEKLYYLPLLFSGLIVLRGIGAYFGNYFLAKVSTNVIHTLRCEIFEKYTHILIQIIAVI